MVTLRQRWTLRMLALLLHATERPTSIHHWQLRDLISAADNEQEFYCVHDTCVYSFNTDTKQVRAWHCLLLPVMAAAACEAQWAAHCSRAAAAAVRWSRIGKDVPAAPSASREVQQPAAVEQCLAAARGVCGWMRSVGGTCEAAGAVAAGADTPPCAWTQSAHTLVICCLMTPLRLLLLLLALLPCVQSKLVTNLGWSANSMTCRAGFLAAGGLHGEVRVGWGLMLAGTAAASAQASHLV